jgi:hypothetical protein
VGIDAVEEKTSSTSKRLERVLVIIDLHQRRQPKSRRDTWQASLWQSPPGGSNAAFMVEGERGIYSSSKVGLIREKGGSWIVIGGRCVDSARSYNSAGSNPRAESTSPLVPCVSFLTSPLCTTWERRSSIHFQLTDGRGVKGGFGWGEMEGGEELNGYK